MSLATGAYGLSLGALAVAAGMDLWQTIALSLLVFSGGSQFAFVGVSIVVSIVVSIALPEIVLPEIVLPEIVGNIERFRIDVTADVLSRT